MSKGWIPTNFEGVCKRAAGRRRYHAERQRTQSKRQWEVLKELEQANWESYGLGRTLSKKLGVSEATISRDVRHWRLMRKTLGSDANEIIATGLRAWQTSDN